MRCREKSIMDTALSYVLFAAVFLQGIANSEPSTFTHDTIRACEGKTATFSWPCDLAYDLVKVMTLTFKGFSSEGQVIVTINSTGRVTISGEYSDRVTKRGTTGIHLERVGILDSGTYLTTATFTNGTVIKREFTLNVQVPPLLKGNQLKVTVHSGGQTCHTVTCGTVLFPGFPALSFHWQTPEGSHSQDSSEGVSTLHGCPLLPGNYTCQVTTSALACGNNYASSSSAVASLSASKMFLDRTVKDLAAKEASEANKELILMIVVPIVTVMTPVVILGVWLLSHFLAGISCRESDDMEAGLSSGSQSPMLPHSPSNMPHCLPSTPDPTPSPSTPPKGEELEENDLE
ncbi:hypothetical protein ACOMHN_018026 [Nucella lapillus]